MPAQNPAVSLTTHRRQLSAKVIGGSSWRRLHREGAEGAEDSEGAEDHRENDGRRGGGLGE